MRLTLLFAAFYHSDNGQRPRRGTSDQQQPRGKRCEGVNSEVGVSQPQRAQILLKLCTVRPHHTFLTPIRGGGSLPRLKLITEKREYVCVSVTESEKAIIWVRG